MVRAVEIAQITGRTEATVRRWFYKEGLKRIPRLGAACWLSDLLEFLNKGDARRTEAQQKRAAHARRAKALNSQGVQSEV